MYQDEKFDELVTAYKQLPLDKKKELAIEEIKKILAFIEKISNELYIENKILINREVVDLNQKNISDEDFVEGVYVYLHSIEECLAQYMKKELKFMNGE